MRFIGNKRKLLPAIEAALEERSVRGGTVLDIFTGTATVARRLRERGFTVTANDRMRQCWTQAVAALVPDPDPAQTGARLAALAEQRDAKGIVSRRYAPGVLDERLFFTAANARRIDAALEGIARWRAEGALSDLETARLLSAILAGADRVANISGTYGAFLKTDQPNALLSFEPIAQPAASGPAGQALHGDALEVVSSVPCDVLYVDPPYNEREYHANYHVLEAIATRPFLDARALARFEKTIYGKTGLLPYERSDFCDRRRCEAAFRELISRCRARLVVVSYSEEGILSREQIVGALTDGLGTRDVEHREISHKRFRSDRDGAQRSYKVLEGRGKDEVKEWLFLAARKDPRRSPRRAAASRSGSPNPSSIDKGREV